MWKMNDMIESHAHTSSSVFDEDSDRILQNSCESGVTAIISASDDREVRIIREICRQMGCYVSQVEEHKKQKNSK